MWHDWINLRKLQMSRKAVLLFLTLLTLNANTIQEQKFLEKIVNAKNLKLSNTKNILNNELKIKNISAKENFTLDIQYKTYFNNLNEQIAKAKNRFRISLTGKIGKMAEDYSSEPEVFRDSWYVGLKVSKPLGSSTLNTSVTKQNRPVGNFSLEESTDTFTKSVEFSLVDRLGAISDEKAARVELLKAINEELETEETITAEVEKA